jgi:hypothetical protein
MPARAKRGRPLRDHTTLAPSLWRISATVTGGTFGVLGAGAVTAHFAHLSTGTTICMCVSAAVCAIIAGTVAIVGTMADQPPETRRMAALQRLASKADTPADRRSAMAMLTMDSAITNGGINDPAALLEAFQAAWNTQSRVDLRAGRP